LGSFTKETYNFKEPTNRSHPIVSSSGNFNFSISYFWSTADQGGMLAYGTDSIIILELDRSNATFQGDGGSEGDQGGGGEGGGGEGAGGEKKKSTAQARFYVLQGHLMGPSASGGSLPKEPYLLRKQPCIRTKKPIFGQKSPIF